MFKPRLKFTLPVLLPALALVCLQTTLHAQAPTFSQIIVFGDSLSDTGNFAAITDDAYDISYPSTEFNYATGRFTDDTSTDPAAALYKGVWHEQLATLFLGIKAADPSASGGMDYACGDAETLDSYREVKEDGLDIMVPNLGKQVSTYIDAQPNKIADPAALYIVWAGSNDLFVDDSDANVTAAAQRETAAIQHLAESGAVTFIVPNVPPLGLTPEYRAGDADTAAQITTAASSFRDQLNADLDALQTTLTNEGLTVTIHRLDIFGLFNRLTASGGAAYGFTNITDSAQGASVNPDKYLFWDDVHPTTFGHFQIAAEAYTLLSGIPVVEVNPIADDSGFYLTRTGTDLSSVLKVHYSVGGSAVSTEDYVKLTGLRKIKANKQTVTIPVTLSAAAHAGRKVKIKVIADPTYALPVVRKVAIKLP